MLKPKRLILLAMTMFIVAGPILGQQAAAAQDQGRLLQILSTGNPEQRLDAIEALGQVRALKAVEPLLAIVQSSKAPGMERMYAAYALGNIGDLRAVKPLIAVLKDDIKRRTGIHMAVIPALGLLGDERAVPVLLKTLQKREDDWLAREVSATALGQIGSKQAVPALINAAWMADTRQTAIAALARMGDARAVEVFISALDQEEEPECRDAALAGLGKIGKAALPKLVRVLESHSPEFPGLHRRLLVIRVLGGIDHAGARAALQKAKADPRAEISSAAKKALARPKSGG